MRNIAEMKARLERIIQVADSYRWVRAGVRFTTPTGFFSSTNRFSVRAVPGAGLSYVSIYVNYVAGGESIFSCVVPVKCGAELDELAEKLCDLEVRLSNRSNRIRKIS